MRKYKNRGWLLVILVCCVLRFGALMTFADVTEAKKGQTYTGDYAVIINTSQQKTESSGTLQFTTGGTESQNSTITSQAAEQSISVEDSPTLPTVQSAQIQRVATVSYQIGDVREGYGYPNGSAVEQSYVCIGTGEHCYIWMEMELMQAYQKKGVLSTIARDTIQVYEGEPYSVLNELCGGAFPAMDGSGKLSIFLETLNTSSGVYMYEPDITAIHLKAPEPAWYSPGQMASYNGLLVHEGQHALLHLMTGFPGEAKWFTEGVSVAVMDYVWGSTDNNGWMHSMQGNEKLQNGASLMYASYRGAKGADMGLDYGIQYLFVRYMIDQMAKEYAPMKVLPGLYQKSASGKTAQQFLTEFTGVAFSSFAADFYTAIAACEKSGKYGFYMDAVAEEGAALYPRYTGASGQAVSIERTGAIIIPLQGGTFTMPTDCGEDIVVRIVGIKTSAAVALSGQGTEESPYLLHSAQELRYIYKAPKAVYRLENDIQMDGTENFTVPSFSGILDGNGHTINRLRRPLVASNDKGVIRDLSVVAAFTSDYSSMQGIIVNENYGTISNCHVSGSVRGRLLRGKLSFMYPMFGGIAGRNYQGFKIENCTSSVQIDVESSVANCWVGGIAGETNGIIDGCSFNGSIRVQQANGSQYTVYAGGITGEVLKEYGFTGSVKNSKGLGTITVTGGTKSVGQICGYSKLFTTDEGAAVYLSNCTWDETKGGQYGTPVSVEKENQVKETEISLSAPQITGTDLRVVQGKECWAFTEDVTGGSGKYTTEIISENLPEGIKKLYQPGDTWNRFYYSGTVTGRTGQYISKYRVKDTVSGKHIVVTVTINVIPANTAKIYSFSFDRKTNGLTKDVDAVISEHEITAVFPENARLDTLQTDIEYDYMNGCRLYYWENNEWIEYYSNKIFDFTKPQKFKVQAADESTKQIYSVTVSKESASAADHEHKPVTDPAVEATCTTDGKTEGVHCSVCKAVLIAQTVIPKHHTIVTVPGEEATCQHEGKTKGSYCSTCGEVLEAQQTIPKTAHRAVTDKGYAATCTDNGLTDGSHCADCHTVLKEQKVIPAKGHVAVSDPAVEATCKTEGKTEGSHCGVCGIILKAQQTTARKQHVPVTDPAVEATYEREGKTEGSHCGVCGTPIKEQQTIPKKIHVHRPVEDRGYAATCTDNGLTDGSHCGDCHAVLKKQEVIPAKGHTPVTDWGYEATCTREGLTNGSHCSICGAILTPQYPIAKTDHHVVWEGGSEATFWNEGRTAGAYCSVCHAVLQEAQTIPRREGTGNLNMTSFPMRVKQKTTALRVENMAAGDWIASWTSSNPAVATVNARGLITARKQGTAGIQVTLASGRVLTAQVRVQKKQVKTTRIVSNTGTVRLKAGTKVRLMPTAYPLTTQQKITYSTKNKKIAKVSGSGWIQAKKQGQTVVTIKSGSKKAKVKVVVYR